VLLTTFLEFAPPNEKVIDLILFFIRMICHTDGCNNKATFGVRQKTPSKCSEHKEQDMVTNSSSYCAHNIRKHRCDECKHNYIRKMVKSEDLERFIKESNDWQEIMEKCDIDYINEDMLKRIKYYNITHLPEIGKFQKIRKAYYGMIIQQSSNWNDVISRLKLNDVSPYMLSEYLDSIAIDYSNIKDTQKDIEHRINNNNRKNITFKDVFGENSTASRSNVKKLLIEEFKWKYECSHCHVSKWTNDLFEDKIISLELDHINGINNDNRVENLRLLCPICHSFTETYRGRNTEKAKKEPTKDYCSGCDSQISKNSVMCVHCNNKHRLENIANHHDKKPSYDDLLHNFRSFKETANLYSVSLYTIRKWFQEYDPEYSKKIKLIKTKLNTGKNYHKQNNCKNCNTLIYNVSTYCNDCEKLNRMKTKREKEGLPAENLTLNKETKKCIDCNTKVISSKATKCKECYKKSVVHKVVRPSYEELLKDYYDVKCSFAALGKKYEVSDNTIRKWIKTDEKYSQFSFDTKRKI